MRILVCVKQVPATAHVTVDEKTGVLQREGVESKLNPYDLFALETALRLREEAGGTVTAITMGPPQAQAAIRETFWMGADEGYVLADRRLAGADVLATSYALSQGIAAIGAFDVILCGKQTTDGDTAQVGPALAEHLGLPHAAWVSRLERAEGGLIAYQELQSAIHAVFLPFPAVDFNDFLALAKTLSVRAAAVTVPFKEAAASCADEASFDVKSCGASNSLIFHRGRIEAYNTDIGGFLKPLTEVIPSLKGKKCLVFGAGGAAAACVCALADRGADVTVLNRTVEKAQRLATRFGCAFGSLEDAAAIKDAAILVQASAAGMTGFEATDPAAAYVYSGNEIAYDIVYKPRETPFLKRAAAAGCRCLYGLEMLEAQARLQFDLFYSPECGLWDERDI